MLSLRTVALFALNAVLARGGPIIREPIVYTLCKHDFSYTWDDGPWNMHQEILDTFNANNAKTTFYMNGDNWSCIYDEDNVQRLRATYESGHQMASHTWSHASLVDLTDDQIDVEILRLDEAFVKILGIRPRFIRPPFGNINDHVISYLKKRHNKKIIMWSDDSTDAIGGTAQDSYNFYTEFARDRPDYPALTLSHEVSESGVDALRNGTVAALAAAGAKLITTAQCLDMEPYEYIGGYGIRDETWTCKGTWTPSNQTSSTSSLPSQTTDSRISTTEASSTRSLSTQFPTTEVSSITEVSSVIEVSSTDAPSTRTLSTGDIPPTDTPSTRSLSKDEPSTRIASTACVTRSTIVPV